MSNNKISEEDQALFRETVGAVDRIKSNRVELAPDSPKARRRVNQTLSQDAQPDSEQNETLAGERIAYAQATTPRKTLNALRKGKIEVEATLDLHGLTRQQAQQQLLKFMQYALSHGLCSLLIIHGKGFGSPQNRPVLKNLVNSWLRQQDYVLAFCSAGQRDGGTGAVRVLIGHN